MPLLVIHAQPRVQERSDGSLWTARSEPVAFNRRNWVGGGDLPVDMQKMGGMWAVCGGLAI